MKKFLLSIVMLAAVLVAQAQTAAPSRSRLTPGRPTGAPATPAGGRTTTPTRTPPVTTVSSTDIAEQIDAAEKGTNGLPALKFAEAPSDLFLQLYSMATGKTLLVGPDVPKATITLRSQVELSEEEYLRAIEDVLLMHGIALLPTEDDVFIRVVPGKDIRTKGIITEFTGEKNYPDKGQMVSRMITLKAILVEEAKKAIEGLKRTDGVIQTFERTNSILITDTQANVNRMLEIIKFIDQPLPVMEEVFVRAIKYAKAEDIKSRIEAMVTESQQSQKSTTAAEPSRSGSPGISTRASIPGVTRPGAAAQPEIVPSAILETLVSDADRGMIRGKVQIISDERSNKLIIITRKANMDFFDKVIDVLDVETAPDVQVKIIRLKYASVEGKDSDKGVVDILNELIGNASSSKGSSSGKSGSSSSSSTTRSGATPGDNRSLTTGTTPPPTPAPAASRAASGDKSSTGKVGELNKDNITVLADRRINAVIVMASPGDMMVLEAIIEALDVDLAQVLIETVVLQVELGEDISTGIDWVQRIKHRGDTYFAGGGGGGLNTPLDLQILPSAIGDASSNAVSFASKGIKYFATFANLNLDMVINASKTDNRTKIISSPIIMTLDNKEATIEATEMRYLYKGVRYSGNYNYGQEVPDYDQRDIGLTVKVTPRISPSGNVVLTVDEKFETIGPNQQVGNDSYPTVNTRKLQADVAVKDGQTVVLGGLVQGEKKNDRTGIPFLMDIPILGYLFGSTTTNEKRVELLVFLTPYVMKTSEDAQREALYRKDALNASDIWTTRWSRSPLADPMTKDELLEAEKSQEDRIKAEEEAGKALKQYREKALKEREARRLKELKEQAKNPANVSIIPPASVKQEEPTPVSFDIEHYLNKSNQDAKAEESTVNSIRGSDTTEVLK